MLILLTLPYSGSTAIAKLLETSAAITGLNDMCEGQWLVPGLCGADRWNPRMPVDWASVKACWLASFAQKQAGKRGARVIVEKSPPNMMRIGGLLEAFGAGTCLVNNRDPYAQCSSFLFRRTDPDRLPPAQREDAVASLADLWLERSAKLRSLALENNLPLLSYEAFCENPRLLAEKFGFARLGIGDLDTGAEVKVKNYPAQAIANQNDRQVAKLTERDIAAITARLRRHPEVVSFFGYSLRD